MGEIFRKTFTTRKPDGTRIDTTVSIPERTVTKGYRLRPNTHATEAMRLDQIVSERNGVDTQPGLWELHDEAD